ncbi:MAG: hypothetical protein WHS44_09940 [Fimbriimonadales bacterium]|nr:MAG: hypothetical protein KatS3mg018_0155 [Fimbriimonadales bacterium]
MQWQEKAPLMAYFGYNLFGSFNLFQVSGGSGMWLETLRGENFRGWLVVILASIVVLALGHKVLDALAQTLVHLLGYVLSESYRAHVERLGGFGGYLSNQLTPRLQHTFFHGWYITILKSVLLGAVLYLGTKTINSRLYLYALLFALAAVWVLSGKGIHIFYSPFWSFLEFLMILMCLLALLWLYKRGITTLWRAS